MIEKLLKSQQCEYRTPAVRILYTELHSIIAASGDLDADDDFVESFVSKDPQGWD